jgi:hypothetical protein
MFQTLKEIYDIHGAAVEGKEIGYYYTILRHPTRDELTSLQLKLFTLLSKIEATQV